MKKKIIRSTYFLSEILLRDIARTIEVFPVNAFLNIDEKKDRGIFHKIIKYRFIPFVKLIYCILYRCSSKPVVDAATLYFSIDRIDLIASLLVMNKSDKRQILWIWNPVSSIMGSPLQFKFYLYLLKKAGLEVWTFDQNDALKYGIRYHPQIYSRKLSQSSHSVKQSYDAFFVGQDKGRLSFLKSLKNIFDSIGLVLKLHIIRDDNVIYKHEDLFLLASKPLGYDEYLNELNRSNCIIEIVQSGQSGLTLRSLEALFFGKKLLTNNRSIIEYDFFLPSNIFIIDDVINEKELREFFLLEYESSVSKYQGTYEVEKFLNSIFR